MCDTYSLATLEESRVPHKCLGRIRFTTNDYKWIERLKIRSGTWLTLRHRPKWIHSAQQLQDLQQCTRRELPCSLLQTRFNCKIILFEASRKFLIGFLILISASVITQGYLWSTTRASSKSLDMYHEELCFCLREMKLNWNTELVRFLNGLGSLGFLMPHARITLYTPWWFVCEYICVCLHVR